MTSSSERKPDVNTDEKELIAKFIDELKTYYNDTVLMKLKDRSEFFKPRALTREGEFVGYMILSLEELYAKKDTIKYLLEEYAALVHLWEWRLASTKEFDVLLVRWLKNPSRSNFSDLQLKAAGIKEWKDAFTNTKNSNAALDRKKFEKKLDDKKEEDAMKRYKHGKKIREVIEEWIKNPTDPDYIFELKKLPFKSKIAENIEKHDFDPNNTLTDKLSDAFEAALKLEKLKSSSLQNGPS